MLADLEQILLAALLADDPVQHLADALRVDTKLDLQERERLQGLSPDGLRLTGLLVKKLRFERLTHGEPTLEELFQQEPAAFIRLYQNYTGHVPPTAYFPREEAELYRRWKTNASDVPPPA